MTIYVRCPGARLPFPMLALATDAHRPAQFVFDRAQLGGPDGLLAFVISGAGDWVERGSAQAIQACLAQAAQALGSQIRGPFQPVQALTEKRRQALVAAVMTQVTLARLRFDYLKEFYSAASDVDENSRQLARRAVGFAKNGMMATPQKVVAEVDAAMAGANRMVAFGDAQEAYAQLVSSLGIDIWSGDGDGVALPDISSTVRRNLQALEDEILTEKGA